jgi:hypothetical protein
MTLRSWWNSFDTVQKLVLVIIPLGLIHHVDHVGRADHSSWPFRPELGPFTFTLLFYPILVAVLLTRNHRVRVVGLGIVSLATLFSHTLVEPPQQVYGTWANNLSTPAPFYTVDPKYMHNLLGVESPILGTLAAFVSIAVTVLLLATWFIAMRDAARRNPT